MTEKRCLIVASFKARAKYTYFRECQCVRPMRLLIPHLNCLGWEFFLCVETLRESRRRSTHGGLLASVYIFVVESSGDCIVVKRVCVWWKYVLSHTSNGSRVPHIHQHKNCFLFFLSSSANTFVDIFISFAALLLLWQQFWYRHSLYQTITYVQN